MTATASAAALATYPLNSAQINAYREQGFLHTPGVLNADEVKRLRELFVSEAQCQRDTKLAYTGPVFEQQVNLWQGNRDLLGLALHPNMRSISTRLAGVPLRLWHDHLLVKKANNGAPTEFHQDKPYWPHTDADESLSAWVALVDVPAARGCMSYIPGSHTKVGLASQDLKDPRSLFEKCPELEWQASVTIPVKAGDVVWHHGYTAHRANANATDSDRVVVSVIYIPRTARYNGSGHICTDGKGLEVGHVIAGPGFPEV
ncbi:MAG: phytanoyl-CoA dioxygenase family protein [Planctomycetota bacterium]